MLYISFTVIHVHLVLFLRRLRAYIHNFFLLSHAARVSIIYICGNKTFHRKLQCYWSWMGTSAKKKIEGISTRIVRWWKVTGNLWEIAKYVLFLNENWKWLMIRTRNIADSLTNDMLVNSDCPPETLNNNKKEEEQKEK